MFDQYRSSEYTNNRKLSKVLLYIIGILLVITSQNEATLQARHIHRILKLHNMYRRMFANGAYNVNVADMKKLEWSLQLQIESRRRLNCETLNELESSDDIRTNVGLSLRKNYSNIIGAWFREIQHFLPKFKTCLHIKDCKHFLTIINAEQKRVGCDATRCTVNGTRKYVLLCMYDGGRSISPPYKSGQPCTRCSNEDSFCDRGLCVPCRQLAGGCDCRKSCNGAGQLNTTSCICKCNYGLGPNCDEPCHNPEQYIDYDICETVTPENCLTEDVDERKMLEEFCPEQCVCNPVPMPDNSD